MPLVHSENITGDCRLIVWELTETEVSLRESLPSMVDFSEMEQISHPQKKREWLAGRLVISHLVGETGQTFGGLWKDEHGKPFLKNCSHFISLTHTLHYIGAVIHPTRSVGIDMEKKDSKLIRTAPKYMTELELAHTNSNLDTYCIYWCAKEALYKLNGRKKVSFRDDIHINPFCTGVRLATGILHEAGHKVEAQLHIRWIEDYCLVVAI